MKFKVGEICEYISVVDPENGWLEREVEACNIPVNEYYNHNGRTALWRNEYNLPGPFYYIAGGISSEKNMRKLKPKQQDNERGEWKECPWMPEHLKVSA